MLKTIILTAFTLAVSVNIGTADGSLTQQSGVDDRTTTAPSSAVERASSMFGEIVAWLSSNFELPTADTAPRIAFATPVELMKLRAADRAQWQGFKYDDDPTIQRNVVAVYDTATTTIYLPPDWTGSSAGDQSVLVHELVHHLQKSAQLKYECPAAREKVAYLAQDAWLRRSDKSLEGEFGVDMFTVVASSACM